MIDIHLAYIHFSTPLPNDVYRRYLDQLPGAIREHNSRYDRWQDRHNHLFGKILLKESLVKDYGFGDDVLELLKYTAFDRPYLEGYDVDFNISHTGSVVACAIGKKARVGLDIEQSVPIETSDFADVHSPEQWKVINSSDDPQRSFFKYWTIKESLIKADGRGLSIPLNQVSVEETLAHYSGSTWHLSCLDLCDMTLACVAIDKAHSQVILKPFDENRL